MTSGSRVLYSTYAMNSDRRGAGVPLDVVGRDTEADVESRGQAKR